MLFWQALFLQNHKKGIAFTPKIKTPQGRYYSKHVAITMEIKFFDRYLLSKSRASAKDTQSSSSQNPYVSFPQKREHSLGNKYYRHWIKKKKNKNRWVKSAREAGQRYFHGNYWRTQHWLISSRNPLLSSSRDAKNIHQDKKPNQAAARGGEARTKEEKSQRVTGMIYKEASR